MAKKKSKGARVKVEGSPKPITSHIPELDEVVEVMEEDVSSEPSSEEIALSEVGEELKTLKLSFQEAYELQSIELELKDIRIGELKSVSSLKQNELQKQMMKLQSQIVDVYSKQSKDELNNYKEKRKSMTSKVKTIKDKIKKRLDIKDDDDFGFHPESLEITLKSELEQTK